MFDGHELEMEFVPPNLREIKVRSPGQSSLMVEGSKQTGSNLPQIICKQEPVEDSVENGYETPTKSSRAGAPSWTSNGGDIKPGKKAWSPVYLEGLEGRFREHCEAGLCLDDQTLKQAVLLFKESKSLLIASIDSIGTGTVEETERLWGACVLYVVETFSCGATVDAEKSKGNAAGFTLSQLMRQTKISVVDFFKELPHFLVKVGPIVQHMYGDEWEKRLQVKEVQANFVHLAALYTHYKRVYQDFFLSPDTFTNIVSRSLSGARDGNHVSIHMQFGWMLFLTLRVHILQQFSDLVTCTNALLVVMVVLILHMPPDLRKFSLQDPVRFGKRTPEGVDLVASLCATYYASDDDVLRLLEKANMTVSSLLRKTLMDSQKHRSDENFLGIKPDGLAYMEGLMDNKSISSNLRTLEKDYEDAYQNRGGLDERMFINGDDSLLGASSNGSPRFGGSKRKYDIMSSPVRFGAFSMGASPSSPAASPWSSPVKHTGTQGSYGARRPPSTPVSITMTTAKWLRTVISPLPAEPSVELQLFFRSCDRDISADVKNRAHVLLELIFSTERNESWQSEAGFMDIIWAEQRRLEAIKLYYKVLGAMCRSEGQRLHTSNLTALLSNERFHRCMITCSAELVLATHKTVTMGFPAVLEPAGITAFDLSKVIEYFVRHEDTLPRELKRHLNTIEERILESMAWEKGSSMYNSLIVARPSLASEINRLCLLAEPMPALENLGSQERSSPPAVHGILGTPISEGRVAITIPTPLSSSSPPRNGGSSTSEASFQSPVKDRLSAFSAFSSPLRNRLRAPLQSAFASPQRPSPLGGGETCADTVINVFFQKALMLAAVRIRIVCERVGQSQQLIERVYKVFQHALHNETNLFFNRHIDQLVLCTIYGVCKVSKVDVKFRDIIHHYRSQPQSKLNVVRNVFIDQPPLCPTGRTGGLESGDIIKFYNDVFVHATKKFLVQLGSNFTSSPRGGPGPERDDGEAPGSPVASIFSTFPDVSPKKVSALHNVFVSPLRSSKVDMLMSPRTRSLYACVGESTKEYQSPSKDLTAINNRLNKRFVANGDLAGWTLKKHAQ